MGLFNLFGGDDSNSSNSTTSNNTSNTNTTNTSYNTSTNTSSNSTVNDTNTLSQDRRIATDHGIGISADASTVTTTNSGNSTTIDNSVDSHNYTSVMSDFGAISSGMNLGAAAIASNTSLAGKTIDASRWITDAGLTLGKTNLDFLQHVADSNASTARNAISEVVAASGNAMNQVVGIAAKPLNAQDPQHILVIVGLVVIGAVLFSKMKV